MRMLAASLLCFPLISLADVPTAPNATVLCPSGEPVEAVEGYLTAMQVRRFADAFEFVTDAMTDGRAKEDWIALQENFFDRGEISIQGLDPKPAVVHGDDSACAEVALVPNILRSRDRFNVSGILEFEVYTVIRDDSAWRIELQETLYDNDAIRAWFPTVELIEVSFSE